MKTTKLASLSVTLVAAMMVFPSCGDEGATSSPDSRPVIDSRLPDARPDRSGNVDAGPDAAVAPDLAPDRSTTLDATGDTATWPPDLGPDTVALPPDRGLDTVAWPPDLGPDTVAWPPDLGPDTVAWPPDFGSDPVAWPPDFGPLPDMRQVDQGVTSPCPQTPMFAGWQPRITHNGKHFAVCFRKQVGGKTQVHVALLDGNMTLLTPPGVVDVQDNGTKNSQEQRIAAGPAGQLAVVFTEVSLPHAMVFQRLSARGALLGKNRAFSTQYSQPDIAYNRDDNEYGVFWRGGFTRFDAATGAQVGGTVTNTIRAAPVAVYNPKDKRYAVLHASYSGDALYLTTHTAAGAVMSSSTVYTPNAGYRLDTNNGTWSQTLAYNTVNNEYGAAFRLKPTSGGSLYTASMEFLQISAAGKVLKQTTQAAQSSYGLLEPTLAWNGKDNYAMVWSHRGTNTVVRAVRFDRAGTVTSAATTVSCPPGPALYPAVAFDGTRWAVVWHGTSGMVASYWNP